MRGGEGGGEGGGERGRGRGRGRGRRGHPSSFSKQHFYFNKFCSSVQLGHAGGCLKLTGEAQRRAKRSF